MPSKSIAFNSNFPAAPPGNRNIRWQGDGGEPQNLAAYVPVSGVLGTHAGRPAAASYAEGTMLYETDRRVLFIQADGAWQYAGGLQVASSAARPGDLGMSDAGYQFLANDTQTLYTWIGSAWIQTSGGSGGGYQGPSVWGPSAGGFVWGPADIDQSQLIWQDDPPPPKLVWG